MKLICSDTIHVWHEPFTDGDECVCKRFALDLRPRDGCAAGLREVAVYAERAQEQQRQFHNDPYDSPTYGDLQSPPAKKLRLHLAEEE